MIFNRFTSLSGEDLVIEDHEYVQEDIKVYLGCIDSSSLYIANYEKNERKLVGWGYNFYLVSIQRSNENVFIWIYYSIIFTECCNRSMGV
jgi:hypothetical protein